MPQHDAVEQTPIPLVDGRLADEEWLRRAYHDDGLTLRDIAYRVGSSPSTVRRRLVAHGVPRRRGRGSPGPGTDRAWLHDHYIRRRFSIRECADLADVAPETVRYWLHAHGLTVRDRYEASAPVQITGYP